MKMIQTINGLKKYALENPERAQVLKQLVFDTYNWYKYRKSDISDIDEHGERVGSVQSLKAPKEKLGVLDLMNTYNVNQNKLGLPMGCTACSHALMMTIKYVFRYNNQSDAFDCRKIWASQKKYPGQASDITGDYLTSPAKATGKFAHECGGKDFKTTNYSVVPKTVEDFKDVLRKGHPICIGAKFGLRRTDQDFNYIPNSNGYGHAFCITGFDEPKKAFIWYDSDGKSGVKKTGKKYLKYDDLTHPAVYQGRIADLIPQ